MEYARKPTIGKDEAQPPEIGKDVRQEELTSCESSIPASTEVGQTVAVKTTLKFLVMGYDDVYWMPQIDRLVKRLDWASGIPSPEGREPGMFHEEAHPQDGDQV